LLFLLRGVDHFELVAEATESIDRPDTSKAGDTLSADALSDVFGIEIDDGALAAPRPTKTTAPSKARRAPRKIAAKAKVKNSLTREPGMASAQSRKTAQKSAKRKAKRSARK
jgi:hypothetical protein